MERDIVERLRDVPDDARLAAVGPSAILVRAEAADEIERLRRAEVALDRVTRLMSVPEWSPDTLDAIAEVVLADSTDPQDVETSRPAFHELPRDEDGEPICPGCSGTEWQYAERVDHWRRLSGFEDVRTGAGDDKPPVFFTFTAHWEIGGYGDEGDHVRIECSSCMFRAALDHNATEIRWS